MRSAQLLVVRIVMDWLYDTDAWKITLALLVAVLLSIEAGHRLGVRSSPKVRGDDVTNDVRTAVMALLGLLLAFTFSFSSERYDARMAVNWREANSIETSYLRAGTLQEPEASQLRAQLREYLEVRIAYGLVPPGRPELQQAESDTERLHREMWTTITRAAQRDRRDLMTAVTIQSLNETIDLATEQRAARRNHVPDAIMLMLFVSIILASILLGYSTRGTEVRNLPIWIAYALTVGRVVFAVMDLDRPRRGLVRVHVDALVEDRQMLDVRGAP